MSITINGGQYNGWEFGCMYNNNEIIYKQDRYDTDKDLIGVIGSVQRTNDNGEIENIVPAMLWFSGDNVNELKFVSGERYFANINKTLSEIKTEMEFDEDMDIVATDNQGYSYDAITRYHGREFLYNGSVMADPRDYDLCYSSYEDEAACIIGKTLDEEENELIQKEYDFFIKWYMTFVDDRYMRADNCFYNNGYNMKSSKELHEINKKTVQDYINDGHKDMLLEYIPEAKEYIDEFKK